MPLPPRFFVSVASKGLSLLVSALESTLVRSHGSVDSKADRKKHNWYTSCPRLRDPDRSTELISLARLLSREPERMVPQKQNQYTT